MGRTVRNTRRASMAVTAALTAAALGLTVGTVPSEAATNNSAATKLAALIQQDIDAGAPGVAVRVNDGSGEPISIARQAGWTRRDHKLSADDQFRMGSNTKTMVGVLVLQLVAQHKLSLDDSVENWVPGLVPGGRNITLRMLLNHTSGLFDYINDPGS